MFHRRVNNYIQKDTGLQFSNVDTKQVAQLSQKTLYKKNTGILFSGSGIPSSRPLHIYRNTGTTNVITTLNDLDIQDTSCKVTNVKWKMLGKNSFKYLNPSAVCQTCRVPSTDTKAPYYPDHIQYIKQKCVIDNVTTPAYNVVKVNNPRFPAIWGGATASNLTLQKKYDAIVKTNQSLYKKYDIRFKYTETPIQDVDWLKLKKPIVQLCY